MSRSTDDLEALKVALTRQLDVLDAQAKRMGIERELMQYPSGEYARVPVLVALAHIEVALAASS